MGFRSTITTEHFGMKMPGWFVEKYPNFQFGGSNGMEKNDSPHLLITSRGEEKFYRVFATDERFLDIQRVLREVEVKEIVAVLLHECGGITRIQISQDKIEGSEPISWKKVGGVTHDYCYGCSDVDKIEAPDTNQSL